MFIHVILDVHSHLYSIQESRISSKTPWRTLWKLKEECPLPVHLEVWNFAQGFLNIYICHSWHGKSSTRNSGIKISSKTPWMEHWILIGECPLAVSLEVWYFYIYHSWHPKSAIFYSGIKNVLQVSLVDAMETHKRFPSSNSPRSLTFFTELPQCLYKSFLIHKVHCQLDSIQESKMSSQTPWRT